MTALAKILSYLSDQRRYPIKQLQYKDMIINKYDRQIRLWGSQGQKRLSEAHVALIGCSGAGIQAIKNLVLPGIGNIHLYDDRKIKVEDLSESFFYEHDSVGRNKAQEACKNLLEMNPDVKGKWFDENVSALIKDPKKLQIYNLVICCDLNQQQNKGLSQILWQSNIAAIFITVVGFLIYVRSQKNVHYVESQKGLITKYYLRLNNPFEKLIEYSKQWDIFKLFEELLVCNEQTEKKKKVKQFGQIPYPIILMQIQNKIGKQNSKAKQILEHLEKIQIQIPESTRDNILEAKKQVRDLFQQNSFFINDEIFSHERVQKANTQSHPIEVFLKIVHSYYCKFQNFPQTTLLPDMHTSTSQYLRFKKLYKEEHNNSIIKMKALASQIMPQLKVDEQLWSTYIDNLPNLKIIEIRPYYAQMKAPLTQLQDEKNVYIAIRSFKIYEGLHLKAPSQKDLQQMMEIAKKLSKEYKIQNLDYRYIEEACRSEGSSYINISSMGGAITSQQAIKFLTGCFTPMNNGYILDGTTTVGYSTKL